jgi:hypothetical protein
MLYSGLKRICLSGSFGRSGFSGASGSINKANQTDQINGIDRFRLAHPARHASRTHDYPLKGRVISRGGRGILRGNRGDGF